MKFIHLGDLHLGKSLGDFDLIEDQKYILDSVLKLVEKEQVEGVLIAGDVYDRALPSEAAVNLLDDFLCGLAQRKCKVFLISGNHDSDDRLNYGSRFFRSHEIFITSVYDGMLQKQTVTDEYGEINIYMLPFVKASLVRHFFPEEEIRTYEDAVRVILKNTDIDTGKRNILVAHQFVASGVDPALGGSESIGTISVGLVEKISYECFEDFDYVALGHIHSPQRVGRDEVRYSGSPLKYSLSEVNNQKSVPLLTFNAKGEVIIELVPLKPKREMRHLCGEMKELLAKEAISQSEDFIYATLTDETPIENVMGIFQQHYPNTIKIDYDNSHTKELDSIDITGLVHQKPFTEMIAEFYQLMYGTEISEEEMSIMKMAAREAGVADETD